MLGMFVISVMQLILATAMPLALKHADNERNGHRGAKSMDLQMLWVFLH
jgi:hypothetical protein